MARTSTTADAFNAVGDSGRRRLLHALGIEECTVNDLVDRVGMSQPQVSKHLAVLRSVGAVSVRAAGRYRWYRVNGVALAPVFEWVHDFERMWNGRLDRLDDVIAGLNSKEEQ